MDTLHSSVTSQIVKTEQEGEIIPSRLAKDSAPKERKTARHQLTDTPMLLKCQPAKVPKIDLLLCLFKKIRDLISVLRYKSA